MTNLLLEELTFAPSNR